MNTGRDKNTVKVDKVINYNYMADTDRVDRRAWSAFNHVPYETVSPLDERKRAHGIITIEHSNSFPLDESAGRYYNSPSYEGERENSLYLSNYSGADLKGERYEHGGDLSDRVYKFSSLKGSIL